MAVVESEPLSMWTVYDHPSDYPDEFIARRWEIVAGGERPTDDVMKAGELLELRRYFIVRGFACIPREEHDDPNIVEVWI